MNKYEIEEIISGDSARDEKIEIEESTCDWCITDSQYITDYSGINCFESCGQIMLCTSPAWSVPKYLRKDEFTCSACKDKKQALLNSVDTEGREWC